MQRKTLTILFADVQGYTTRTARQTREENELFIKEIKIFVEKHAKDKGGSLVKTMGDGFLLTFESPTDAINCGLEMQRQIEQRNANILNQDNFIRFRIGISTGEVTIDENNDVYGDAVNISARIQKFSAPNEVYISESTYLAMNKSEIKAADLGPQQFKNVLQQVRVYRVLKKNSESAFPRESSIFHKTFVIFISGVIAAAVIAGGVFILSRHSPKKEDVPAPLSHEETIGKQREQIRQLIEDKNYHEARPLPREYFKQETDPFQKERALRKMEELESREKDSLPAPEKFEQRPPEESSQKIPPKKQRRQEFKQLMEEGNYNAVIEKSERILENDPDNPKLHDLAAEAYFRNGDFVKAEQHLREAMQISPERIDLYYRLYNVYRASERPQQAAQMLREYIDREHDEFRKEQAQNELAEFERDLRR